MWLRFLIAAALCISVSGCATGKKMISQKDAEDLQGRVSELEIQVQEKDQQIRDLEDELASAQKTSVGGKCYVEQGRLSNKQVQKALKNAGYYTGPVDGRIGKKTRRAIKDFQKASGLAVDGIVGKETRTYLRKYLD